MNITFSFGRNWKNYVKNVVNETIIEEAKQALLRYLPEENYKEKTFIDVGCGSGLFSFAALRLGCRKVISFDVDKKSIEATLLLKSKFKHLIEYNRDWDVFEGSILDESLVQKLDKGGDIVYSWGVLHHTGNMWKAIENVCELVKEGGYLIIAIYNHAPSSEFWLTIKRFYNNYKFLQPLLNIIYGSYVSLGFVIRRRKFNLKRERGMHVFYDAIDWLGGLPYEFACADEVIEYIESLGFKLVSTPTKLPCGKGFKSSIFDKLRSKNTGCNEFVFRKL
jgi:SAM-dependent methyltransferase